MRIVVITFLFFIIYTLGAALYYLVKDKGTNPKVVKNLTLRVALSVFLFLMLMVSNRMGWIGDRL